MILPMVKVQVIGPRRLLSEALRFLHGQGVLHLRRPGPGAAAFLRPVPLGGEEAARVRSLEASLRRIEAALALLPAREARAAARAEGAAPRGAAGAPEPEADSAEVTRRIEAVEGTLAQAASRKAALAEESRAIAQARRALTALSPLWKLMTDAPGTRSFGLLLKRGGEEALPLLEREIARLTDGAYDLHARAIAGGETALLLAVPRWRAAQVSGLLFERGVEELKLPPAFAGRPPAEVLLALADREHVGIPRERAALDAGLATLARAEAAALEAAAGRARERLDALRAMGDCAETGHAFVVTGYLPRERLAALAEGIRGACGGRLTLFEYPVSRRELEEVPVVLRNPAWLRPFERLLALVPPPRYGSIDPTPWLAFTFPFFLGLVLGDVAIGLFVGTASAWAFWRFRRGGVGRDVAVVGLACALSTVAFGFLFGEVLGDAGARAGLHPIWIERRGAILTLLAATVGVGLAHVALGLALGVAEVLHGGERREILGRLARLGLLAGAVLALGGGTGFLPSWAARAGYAVLAVSAVTGIAADGFLAPLELVMFLGNVLSYARLMALGLASVLLAEAANLIAATLDPAVLGICIAVLLHAVNATLGLLSPAVASLRLHYVEFFEKFYESGGTPYRPLGGTA
ncbi:V-type ATP synthase subunit I [Anaeromyxobacter paludicola]|uniref:V-type ATP synthase subunit I n=1 Tax=Anaeromyxobacter paludicola TaxID=2918171 RepID=A0ABN6N4T4_9BACT|nr:ATPase [Anaeromyxobacter paludicola]BDG08180.1 hypothetical protein AMPC_12930 [Anaeromyxobacter paludicola]